MLDLEDDLPQELEEFADNFVDFCPLNERPGRKATIYRARSCFVDQTVAIKIVPKPEVDGELDLVQRLRNEAVATAAASHPNIVRIQHGGITREGHAYILLEYLDGRALSRLLQEAPLEPARALDIAIDVASALVALHDKGIIHNAVTPDNIIVTQAAAKLVDLSLAYVPQLPGYPERREGPARRPFECLRCEPSDPRRDVYGLAATLWAALLGGYQSTVDPMVVDSSTTVRALGAVPSVDLLPPSVPATLREVISRGIASAPEERYTCMADLLTALRVERALWSAQDLRFRALRPWLRQRRIACLRRPRTAPKACRGDARSIVRLNSCKSDRSTSLMNRTSTERATQARPAGRVRRPTRASLARSGRNLRPCVSRMLSQARSRRQ